MSLVYSPFWDFIDTVTDQVDSLNRHLEEHGVPRDGKSVTTIPNKSLNGNEISTSNINKRDPFYVDWDDNTLFAPTIDVYDTEKQIDVHASVPGTDQKDINIDFDPKTNQLTISGETQTLNEEKQKELTIKERRTGKFERTVQLSRNIKIDEENIKAKYNNGVLELTLPKSPESTAPKRKILIEN